MFKNSYKGVSSIRKLNNILLKEKTRAMDIINDLFDKKELEFLSIKQIKDKIVRTSKYESFFEFGYGLVEELKKARRYGTARSYSGTLGTFKTYNNNKDLKFNELNYDFLLKYESPYLSKGNSINGCIRFQRSKTGKLYDIKITDQLMEIFSIYTKGKEKDQFIFPIIKRDILEQQHKDIDWERHRYNKGLKRIAILCDIDHNITSYVSRHSFATQAMLQNVP